MSNQPARLCDEDRELLLEVRRLLQGNAGLLRGLMASLPRPEPRGEWGRPASAPVDMTPRPRAVPPPALPVEESIASAPTPEVPPPTRVRRGRPGGAPSTINWPAEEQMRALHRKHEGNIAAIARHLNLSYFAVYEHYRNRLRMPAAGRRRG